jgi:hypothetical protein
VSTTRWARAALIAACLPLSLWLGGCAAPPKGDNLAAFRAARPASILILPPLNESPEVIAPMSFLAQASQPLAEDGYYVMPVGVMVETFRQNGLTEAHDIHDVSRQKLRDIFGADAALYIRVTQYGSQYTVLRSEVRVSAQAHLVDLRSGQALWSGTATASNDEGGGNNSGGLVGALITAVVKQVVNSISDSSHPVAGVAANRLLRSGWRGAILWGPRSPWYGKDGAEGH